MLPVSIRDRLSELSGAELKVWICYRSHANAEGLAWPGRVLLHEETGLSPETISAARSSLSRKRWLVTAQGGRNSAGKFGSPRLKPVIPSVSDCDRDWVCPPRTKPASEYHRDGEKTDREGEMPFYRDGENPLHRDEKTPSLSISSEGQPEELVPREGEDPAPRGASATGVAPSFTEIDPDPNSEVPW